MCRTVCRVTICVLVLSLLAACSEELSGPEPQMESGADEIVTDPSFTCNDTEGKWITLSGEDFSPLVFDAIASERDHDVELPRVILTLRSDPTGADTEESFAAELTSPPGAEDGHIRWLDGETLQFLIDDSLELPAGIYDVQLINPNGESVTESEAFGIINRPSLEEAIPELTCVAQGDRHVVLHGDDFLVQGEQEPTVTVGDEEVAVLDVENCRDLHPTFGGHQLCESVTIQLDEASLEAGVYDVVVHNFDPAGCSSRPEEDEVTVTIADPPRVDSISPSPICGEQLDYETMEVVGEGFIVVHDQDSGEAVYPEVHVGTRSYDAFAAEGCESIETAPQLQAERCTQISFAIGADDLSDQTEDDQISTDLDVVVSNPDPVGCHSTEELHLTTVPPPRVDAASPDPICTAQFENSFTLEGFGFLIIDGAEPVVHIGDETYEPVEIENCEEIETPEAPTESCTSVTIVIPVGDQEVGPADIVVENPETAACSSTEEARVEIVAPPTVDSIDPHPVCIDDEDRLIEVGGAGFLDIDGALPTVQIGNHSFDPIDIEDCEEIELFDETRELSRCARLIIQVEAGLLDADLHDIVVTNPEPAACHSEEEIHVETVPAPVITAVQPRAVCTGDGTTPFEVEGEYFYEVDGVAPEILFDGAYLETSASQCTDVDGTMNVRQCEHLSFAVDPAALSDEIHELVAINPDPIGCESDPSPPVALVGPPDITGADPGAICENDPIDADMTIFGHFVFDPVEGFPHLTMGGETVAVDDAGACQITDLDDFTLHSCEELYATVPDHLRDDPFDIVVTGIDPVACGEDTLHIERVERATIDLVSPERVCYEGGTIEVYGENIHPDAEFYLDTIPATTVDVSPDGTYAQVTFDGPLDPPEMTLSVVNPGDCGSTYETEIHIARAPLALYVDPPATYDGMTTRITIYAAGFGGGNVEVVELVHPDGTATALDFDVDPERPFVIQATVPEGMLDTGEDQAHYGIRLTDDFSCASLAEELLIITSELTVAVEEIIPPFGHSDDSTGVIITAEDPPDDPDHVQFVATPRAYLNPVDIDGELNRAQEIRSLQFIDETELRGIVTSGLPVGTYDVIVVNPDGSVGVLHEGFTVTEEPPPLIDSVSPGSWTNDQDALEVEIEGQNFRDPVTVEVFCRAPDDVGGDFDEPNEIAIVSVDEQLVVIEVDTNNLDHLDACFMRLTNPDGSYAEYSPITITNPAGKFVDFIAGSDFDTPRRGLTAFSGVAARQTNFLYVVGGDDGVVEGAYRSGEFASLDRFGMPQSWHYLPYELPTGRTLADGVRVEDFVYLLGGHDGTSVTTEILRAQVLSPLDVPEIISVDLIYDEEQFESLDGEDSDEGLEAGVYYYRVSAVFDTDDPANPGGESLTSEPQPIKVPLDGAIVTIDWQPPEITNHEIVGYRVYRSVEPDAPYGEEGLLADVDATTFTVTDDGSFTPIADERPLRLGSLGTWDHVADLQHPRMVAGITMAQNPSSEDEYFVYAIGGEDNSGDFRADYEVLTITAEQPRHQSVDPLAQIGEVGGETMVLPSPRGELQAVMAYEGNAVSLTDVPPQIFVLGGQSEGIDDNRDVFVTTVNPDGHLDEWTQLGITQRINNDRMGMAAVAINDNMVVAGGVNGAPSDSAHHAQIACEEDCPPAEVTTPPGWQSLGDVSMEPRVWLGHTAFRGFWYLAGGLTTGNEPTNTVDFSVAGGTP